MLGGRTGHPASMGERDEERIARDRRRVAREGEFAAMFAGEVVARWGRLALSKTEAAEALGVSDEFFDRHVAPDLQTVRRGRRVLYPTIGLLVWLWLEADEPLNGSVLSLEGDRTDVRAPKSTTRPRPSESAPDPLGPPRHNRDARHGASDTS